MGIQEVLAKVYKRIQVVYTCLGRDTGSTCLGTVRVQTIGTCTMHSRGYNQKVYFCAGGYTCSTCKDTVGIHKLFVQVWIK